MRPNSGLIINFSLLQDTDERISYLNCLKMNLYLFCQLVRI